jgi:hypothetical protein
MATTNDKPTLQERARDRRLELEQEDAFKEIRAREQRLESSRRTFGWALARALELGYDAYLPFPDHSFPGLMAWNEGAQDWAYTQDGLTFSPSPYYTNKTVLLQGLCRTCDGVAYRDVHSLDFLDTVLNSDDDWQCDYCRSRQREEEESATPYVARVAPPPPKDPLENMLEGWIKDIDTAQLTDLCAEGHG